MDGTLWGPLCLAGTLTRVSFEGTLGGLGLDTFNHSSLPVCTMNGLQSKRQENEYCEGKNGLGKWFRKMIQDKIIQDKTEVTFGFH